jgi:hypothetical protein
MKFLFRYWQIAGCNRTHPLLFTQFEETENGSFLIADSIQNACNMVLKDVNSRESPSRFQW